MTLIEKIKQMHFFTVCSYCDKVQMDTGWCPQDPEIKQYILQRFIAAKGSCGISHGICPGCYEQKVKPQLEALKRARLKKN